MKIWKITCCNECPKIGYYFNIAGQYDYCYRENKRVKNVHKIASWCTLPDYKEDV